MTQGTEEYHRHKEARFKGKEKGIVIAETEAFLLSPDELREQFKKRYSATAGLYYKGQPPFEDLLSRIKANIEKL
jgi:hypothetical protein